MKKFRLLIIIIFISFVLISCSCSKMYFIEYDFDGGSYDGNYTTSFNKVSEIKFFTPIKEGYIFIGWQEGSYIIETFENKNYSVKAVWAEKLPYQTIKDTEIFKQTEESYFVYFYRDNCSWCEKIEDDILKYLFKQNRDEYLNSTKLYVVNLMENGVKSIVSRSYSGEDAEGTNKNFKVTNATSIDELYIAATPSLILIENIDNLKTAKFLSSGSTKTVSQLNNGLKYFLPK